MLAAKMGRTEIVELLIKAGADVNMKNKLGSTAFITTITCSTSDSNTRHTEIVELLINAGADYSA